MNVFEERGITHLDLHGVRHHNVEDDVYDFVLSCLLYTSPSPRDA